MIEGRIITQIYEQDIDSSTLILARTTAVYIVEQGEHKIYDLCEREQNT